MDWDTYFLDIADTVKKKSKDRSTQTAAVIVGPENQILSTGFNGFPRMVNESLRERWERPIKYCYVEHAERNAIYNAARHGVPLRGSTMYVTGFGASACTDCARAIIQSGIVRLIGKAHIPIPERWADNLAVASTMLREAGVEITEVE